MIRSLVLTLAASSLVTPETASADDRRALVGTWAITVFQDDGRDRLSRLGAGPVKQGRPRVAKLVFDEESCWVLRGDGRREVSAGLANAAWKSITLDSTTTPKSIDIVGFAGKDGAKTKTYVGLYALEGTKLKICWCEQGTRRPTKLESDGANNLFVCEKVAAKPQVPTEKTRASGRETVDP